MEDVVVCCICVLGFIFFWLFFWECMHYDATCNSYDHMCKAVSKRPIRIVEYMSYDDAEIRYYIQYRLPITMRWKNWLTCLGLEYYCIDTFNSVQEAKDEILKIQKRAGSGKIKMLREIIVQN